MRRPRPSAMSLTLWSECKEARLASRTQRFPKLLEQKIMRRSVFDLPDSHFGFVRPGAMTARPGRLDFNFAPKGVLFSREHDPP
jgi:hypothetical protein